MTKEYLKMTDVFDESVDSVEKHYGITNAIVDGSSATLGDFVTIKHAQYAAHAINSHDDLVAEVERLRGAVDELERENENISAILLERTSALGPYI